MSAARKLVDLKHRRGLVCGTVYFPTQWLRDMEQMGGKIRISMDFLSRYDPGGQSWPDYIPSTKMAASGVTLMRYFVITQTYFEGDEKCIILDHISIEEFERLPECSFIPSGAYVRYAAEQAAISARQGPFRLSGMGDSSQGLKGPLRF